jgi:hypothetical protein
MKFKILHIQNPYRIKKWVAFCDEFSKEAVTDLWNKVSCPKCMKLMRQALKL